MAFILLIANYPYYVAFFFQTLGIFFIFVGRQANNDVYFTTLLPVPKRATVKAIFVGVAELSIQLIPALKTTLDTLDLRYLPQQLAVLIFGILVFLLVTTLAYLKSATRFEKIDL